MSWLVVDVRLANIINLICYEFCFSLWKIARCSVILLLPLFMSKLWNKHLVQNCYLAAPSGTLNETQHINLFIVNNHVIFACIAIQCTDLKYDFILK